MATYAAPMSSAGWILAHGARRADATVTNIAFGETVTLLVPPHQRPARVQQMQAHDSYERFTDADRLADHLLHQGWQAMASARS